MAANAQLTAGRARGIFQKQKMSSVQGLAASNEAQTIMAAKGRYLHREHSELDWPVTNQFPLCQGEGRSRGKNKTQHFCDTECFLKITSTKKGKSLLSV